MQSDEPGHWGCYFEARKRLWGFTGCHQYNGRERRLPWWSAATGPHRPADGHLRITPGIAHSRPYFSTSQCSREFPWPPDWLFNGWATPYRPTSLVVAQPGDWRQSPESAKETSLDCWTGLVPACTESSWSDSSLCAAASTQTVAAIVATWWGKRLLLLLSRFSRVRLCATP